MQEGQSLLPFTHGFQYSSSHFDHTLIEYKESKLLETAKSQSNCAIFNFAIKILRHLFYPSAHLENVVKGLEVEASKISQNNLDDVLNYLRYTSLFKERVIDKHHARLNPSQPRIDTAAMEQVMMNKITEANFNAILACALMGRLPALVKICHTFKPQCLEQDVQDCISFKAFFAKFQENSTATSEDYGILLQAADLFQWEKMKINIFKVLLGTVLKHEIDEACNEAISHGQGRGNYWREIGITKEEILKRKALLQKYASLLTDYEGEIAIRSLPFFCTTFSNLNTLTWTPLIHFDEYLSEHAATQLNQLTQLKTLNFSLANLSLEGLKCLQLPSLTSIEANQILLKEEQWQRKINGINFYRATLNEDIDPYFDPTKEYSLESSEAKQFKNELKQLLEPLFSHVTISLTEIHEGRIRGNLSLQTLYQ